MSSQSVAGVVDCGGREGVYKILKKHGCNFNIVQNPIISLEDDMAVTKRDRGYGDLDLVGCLCTRSGFIPQLLDGPAFAGLAAVIVGNPAMINAYKAECRAMASQDGQKSPDSEAEVVL